MSADLTLAGDWATQSNNYLVKIKSKNILMNFEGSIKYKNFDTVKKAGPILTNSCFPNFKNLILNLANNHFMDLGHKNALDNIKNLKKRNFKYIGFGKNLKESRKELILRINKKKIALIGCCEPQFGVSKIDKGGVAEVGPWVTTKILELKKKCDYIIVSIHGGLETSPWPAPETRDLYRSWINVGASIIHGHHSHIPQVWEKYKNGYIFYGLGNFCVDPQNWKDHKNNLWSIAVDLKFKKKLEIKIRNLEIKKNKNSVLVLPAQNNEKYKKYFDQVNSKFHNEDILEDVWNEFSIQLFNFFGKKYMKWNALPIKTQAKNIIKSLLRKKHNNNYLYYYHMLALDSHRLMLKNATSILCGEKKYKSKEKIKRLINKYCYF